MFVNTSDSAVNLKLHQDYLKSHANLNINTKTYHLCNIWDLQWGFIQAKTDWKLYNYKFVWYKKEYLNF